MKDCIELPAGQRMTGEDLCSEYNSSLDNRMKAGIPALSVIYEVSGKHMHARTGAMEDFNKLIQDIEAHISAKIFLKSIKYEQRAFNLGLLADSHSSLQSPAFHSGLTPSECASVDR